MSRLSSVDSSFLRVESPNAHMHVGWMSLLELPPAVRRFDLDELKRRIAGRLHLLPRFRQRITRIPLGAGEPVWRDDPGFELDYHVRELPPAFAARGVRRAADAFFTYPLRRDRPLWEIAVIPRLTDGRAAILGKLHHAMVDGVAAVELGMLLFDATADAAASPAERWLPVPTEGPARLALDAVADAALEQFRVTRRALGLARSPAQTVRVAGTLRRAAFSIAEDALRPAPPSYLNVDIGPTRTVVTHRVDLGRLLVLKTHLGVTLNDVVLATCAGALRRFALDRAEPAVDLRVMVPVNVRRPGEDTHGAGNRITFGFAELPVGSDRAEERVRRVAEAMNALKHDGRLDGSAMLLSAAGMLPDPLKDRAARLAASPRLYNLTISNVPGPRVPLYACGARVHSIHPVIPIPDRHALSIGVLTYNGAANFGIYADPRAIPRPDALTIALEDDLIELEAVARHRDRASGRAPARTRGAAPRRRPGVVAEPVR